MGRYRHCLGAAGRDNVGASLGTGVSWFRLSSRWSGAFYGTVQTVDNGGKNNDSDEIRTRAGNPSRIEDGPKRDAVTTWLHCRVEGGGKVEE